MNSVLGLLVVSIVFGTCVALECYSCVGGSDCGEPFTSTSTETCSSNTSVCSVFANLDRDLYIRSCDIPSACSNEGCVRNAGAAGSQGICTYCCDDHLCNNRSVADGVADILHCYLCSSNIDAACANDVRNANVATLPCEGVCMVQEVSVFGTDLTTRSCQTPDLGACVPGCDGSGTCTACCTGNLCNNGSVESINNGGNMKTTPSVAQRPTSKGAALECYKCVGGSDCGEPFTSTSTETCSGSSSVCSVFADLERNVYIRSCDTSSGCSNEGCIRNAGAAGSQGVCTYCCEDNLCNGRSVADGVADILHCYTCSSNIDAACANDVRNANVATLPCSEGVCMVREVSVFGTDLTTRSCLPPGFGACVPGCDGFGTCTACCTGNLCNSGSVESINNGENMKTTPSKGADVKSSVILTLLIPFYTAVYLG